MFLKKLSRLKKYFVKQKKTSHENLFFFKIVSALFNKSTPGKFPSVKANSKRSFPLRHRDVSSNHSFKTISQFMNDKSSRQSGVTVIVEGK